jgi:hypothetical protein
VSCIDCYGEGTYRAYAIEQMSQLHSLLRERKLLNGKWIMKEGKT